MTEPALRHAPLRFRGRSFVALVLAPEAPLAEWLVGFDRLHHGSPGFFDGRAVILDLTRLHVPRADVLGLLASLGQRGVRVVGLEGVSPALAGPDMPPVFKGGKLVEVDATPAEPSAHPAPEASGVAAEPPSKVRSLVIDGPVRSGQSIMFLEGDVTVVGAIASGAEVIAGGSVHVYGAIRGRVIAGADGHSAARIHCSRLEAELLAIDGCFKTADDIEAEMFGGAAMVSLAGDRLRISRLPA
ncbi:septum site-determining protein MinC [Salinarimonas soli]|uniref:Probable septum site-determining protein MinC n=1 Tax=Salinarimonas soli TaxID=1638099 RepID=A0A5B2VIE5_9HYPH|nr:septum site-determining protein MinC [Salinarimonas soli]KAA2238122.1 septum formation inhibitor MinC [Salinarimonas soli]